MSEHDTVEPEERRTTFTALSAINGSGAMDYTTMEFTFAPGDNVAAVGNGDHWEFGPDTIQPGITAYELAQVLAIRMTIADGFMGRIKNDPWLLRHFRRVRRVTNPGT